MPDDTAPETVQVLPAEFVGMAAVVDGTIAIGGCTIQLGRDTCSLPIYVRRKSNDLSVIEIALAFHDGFAQEELDEQNAEAERYPLGVKEYWRSQMVGKYTYGTDRHVMTNDEFEDDWDDDL